MLARDWMRFLGFADAQLTAGGPDGGLDVTSTGAVAQVKFKANQVGTPDLQRLFGARGSATHRRMLFFTGTSYSVKALAYAAEHSIGLFIYDLAGGLTAANPAATALLADARRARDAAAPSDSASTRPESNQARPPGQPVRDASSSTPRLMPTGTRTSAMPSAGASGIVAAAVFFLPATLCLVGFGAAGVGAQHQSAAIAVGIVGLLAYVFALYGVHLASRGPRLSWRWPLGLSAVLLVAGPAIALWTALAIAFAKDDGPAPLLVLVLMIAPILLVGLLKPATPPK